MKNNMIMLMGIMMSEMAVGEIVCSGSSASVAIDSRTGVGHCVSVVPWDASWCGGNPNAIVVIADKGVELKRATGSGEFVPSNIGRHELTYTTFIDGVAQDEVYTAVLFKDWRYEVVGDGAVIVETTETAGDVTIPSEINGYVVTGIDTKVFRDRAELTSVTLPSNLTSISSSLFEGCSGLTSISIPVGVTNISENAFISLGSLTNVTVVGCMADRTMAEIFPGSYRKIRHVDFVGDIASLPENFFDGCDSLESVSVGEGVAGFGGNDMRWAIGRNPPNGLFVKDGWVFGWVGAEPSSIVIPEGVKGIAPYALRDLYDLESVQLPSTLKYIGARAFAGDSYLDDVVIPDGVEMIGEGAFEDCSYMQTLTLGSGVKTVGRAAFAGCTKLASAEFADGLLDVGEWAFSNCWRMASVSLPLSTTNVGSMAFAECASLTGVTTPTGCGTMEQWFGPVHPNIESVTVPDGETLIVPGMFAGCTSLAMIQLPEGITNIGALAFRDCSSLTEMAVPGGVVSLGAGAFEGCSQISTMSLPNGLGELPDNVFAGCGAIDSFVVPASVTNLGSRFCSSGTTAIYYLGNAPAYADDAYGDANEALTSYVVNGTKGWDGRPNSRDIPQSWIGHAITTWSANRFDVTFDANGGLFMPDGTNTFAKEEVTDTSYSLPPNEPVRPGYKFAGYWTERTAGSRVTSSTRVTLTKAHTLYAHWQVGARVTVRFNACGGTVQPESDIYTAEAPYGELPVPTREHYRFAGWWTMSSGGSEATIASEVPKADHELFAHWEPAPCIVRFHACNGTTATRDQEFVYGESFTLDANTFAMEGYAFAGWATTEGGQSVYPDGKTLVDVSGLQNDVLHLYAVWVSTRYAVRFDSNGGTGQMDNQTLVRDIATNLIDCAFVRMGYEFSGWAAYASGPVVYADGAVVSNVYEQTGSDVALFAVWVPIEYSVHYDPNGGAGEMEEQAMVYDEEAPLAASQFSMAGALFRGWATTANGAVEYREQASVKNLSAVAEDVVTLYAVWQEKPASVVAIEDAFDGSGTVALDDDDNIVVTVTNDISGTVEIPDNVGNVTIDLNGHDIVGDNGGAGLRIVGGQSGEGAASPSGDATRLVIEDTSEGEKGVISGNGDGAGIEIADDAAPSVRLDVDEGIAVLNGDGTEQDWEELMPVERTLKAGEYFKATLAELGYDVPTDGVTMYDVKALGLPAGLQLKYNAAVTKKVKQGKTTKTVVVKPAKVEWWIEGVPTTAVDFFTNPPYLVITANGTTTTEPLPVEVLAQNVTELEDLALGQMLNEQYYLPGVTNGWTVSGLPTGLKYAAKLLTTSKKVGKKTVVTTNALPYSVYGKTTKAGLFTITAKRKTGAYYETMKFRVLVRPKAVDSTVFGNELTNITTMAYENVDWDLTGDGGALGDRALPIVPSVAKVAGLPAGVTFAAKNTYAYANPKKKTGKYLKQKGQTIVGTPTKAGTYVVTFTKNVTTGTGKNKKTVAKTAQILWTVVENDAGLELAFNNAGGVIESGSVGLKYGDLLAFAVTSNATVTASGLPAGIKLAKLDAGDGGALGDRALPGFATYGFTGFTAKAGTYLVTVKATLNGKSVTQRVALKVDGLPAWAKGTFNGIVRGMGNGELGTGNGEPGTGNGEPGTGNGEQVTGATNGLATITVSAAGKISGKFYEGGTNWTFSAASYTVRTRGSASLPGGSQSSATEGESFICSNVVAKYAYKVKEKVKGKVTTVTKYVSRKFVLVVGAGVGYDGGVAAMEELRLVEDNSPHQDGEGTRIEAWQKLWGTKAYKTLGAKLFYTSAKKPYKTFTIKGATDGGAAIGLTGAESLSLKVTPAGAVTATMSFDTGKTKKNPKTKKTEKVIYKATCQTVVIPLTAADANPFVGQAFLYFAPSAANGFAGYAGVVPLPF